MSHLTTEDLARLVDEPATPEEERHLAACLDCAEELEAMCAQSAALSALPDPDVPKAVWAHVERRLAEEGLLRRRPRALRDAPWLRIAAAIVLFVAGGAAGSALRARSIAPFAARASEQPRVAQGPASGPASFATQKVPSTGATSIEAAEAAYLQAIADYARANGGTPAYDPVARLAALESILSSTRAALNKAPADPIINGYYMTAYAQREAMLKQLAVPTDTTWF